MESLTLFDTCLFIALAIDKRVRPRFIPWGAMDVICSDGGMKTLRLSFVYFLFVQVYKHKICFHYGFLTLVICGPFKLSRRNIKDIGR